MSSQAWIFQRTEHIQKMGEEKAPWYVGYYDFDGRRHKESCGAGLLGKKKAERRRAQLDEQLMTGTLELKVKKLWKDFRQEYEERVLPRMATQTQVSYKATLDKFEQLAKPLRVLAIDGAMIDKFITARRQEPGIRPGELLSPRSVNKDLLVIHSVLETAVRWKYLRRVPEFEYEKVPESVFVYVTPDAFGQLYGACEHAQWPDDQPYAAADWWRGLLVFGYLTGWRIRQMLSIRREDVNLEHGTALSRAKDNKGKRDQLVHLHPLIVEHLQRLASFDPLMFPWNRFWSGIFVHFRQIQQAAKVPPPTGKPHYTFHDFRRAFATENASRLTGEALQALMQHRSYKTTQGYIDRARQLRGAVDLLFVPQIPGNANGTSLVPRPAPQSAAGS